LLLLCALIAFPFITRAQSTAPSTQPRDPARWEEAIRKFEESDRTAPPPRDAILFIGSSSIRGWKLNGSFPDLPTINRGFGGSEIADSVHFADRIVLPYRPRTIVFYAGENDITAGKTPDDVAHDFQRFVKLVRAELPGTKIIYIGLKPSPLRWRLIDPFRETNKLIREFIATQQNIIYIDVESHMLGADGEPRAELFLDDKLHLNRTGYELWTKLVRPHLLAS
jgi:lysophospholipase L1-like esterase